jgi:hypothetical protein
VSDLVERDIVNAKAPDKISDVADVLLMQLRRQEGFEHPLAAVYLAVVPQLGKGGDAITHDGDFTGTLVYIFYANWFSGAGVDDARIVLYGDELSLIVEDGPIFLDDAINHIADGSVQMGEVQLLVQFCNMGGLVVPSKERRVNLVKRGAGCLRLRRMHPPLMLQRMTSKSCDWLGKPRSL